MDIAKNIADIMKKYKDRDWKVSIDNLALIVSIQPDITDYDEYCDNWIKIVYEYCQFDEPYLDLKQMKKLWKEFEKNKFDFLGLSLDDMAPVIDVMNFIQNNHEAIRDTINEYYTIHPSELYAGKVDSEFLMQKSYSLGTGGD